MKETPPKNRTVLTAALTTATALLTFLGTGCGDQNSTTTGSATRVITTTTQLGDIVRNVGGDTVDVTQILQSNSDPHGYEPRPSDAIAVTKSDIAFKSGQDIDDWLNDLLKENQSNLKLVDISESLKLNHHQEQTADEHSPAAPNEDHHDHSAVDPHWWQNPLNAIRAVDVIRTQLVKLSPKDSKTINKNTSDYINKIRELDNQIDACFKTIPAADRKLVTSHDALGYFAERYELEVIGTVIPSLSTQAQSSAGDVSSLIRLIKRSGVKTIFPESSINPKLEKTIAQSSGAKVGPALWADTLGPKGSSGETYLGSLRYNAFNIASGMVDRISPQCRTLQN